MKTFHLTWEPNPCGTPAESYSVYWRRSHVPRSGSPLPVLSADEIVSGGTLLADKISESEYLHTTVGLGNNYAVVSHFGDRTSPAKVIAANLSAKVELE